MNLTQCVKCVIFIKYCVYFLIISESWYTRFKSGDFDTEDKEREGKPETSEVAELEPLLNQDCSVK